MSQPEVAVAGAMKEDACNGSVVVQQGDQKGAYIHFRRIGSR